MAASRSSQDWQRLSAGAGTKGPRLHEWCYVELADLSAEEYGGTPEEFDAYENIGEHYAGIRRWSPAFLNAFAFEGVPAAAPLMRAIEVLREATRKGSAALPKSAPTGFIRQRWASLVLPGGAIDRRHYELCVLSELRGRLQAGDIWVSGSRRYRSFDERLISEDTLEELQQAGMLPIAVESDFEQFIAGHRTLLDARLAAVDASAKDGRLPDVSIDRGVPKIAPIEKSTPPEAEALAGRLYAMLPRIRITDLMAEVAGWTLFPDCFTHLRTGEAAADVRILLAGLLADGLNLGLTRMAEACSVASLAQLAWTSDWHIRDETYALALRRLINQQQRELFAARFGSGTASSSDGQFFQAAGFGRDASRLNGHYGQKPGFKVYTHMSDRYGPFYTKLIAATASEALHVLDALLYHQSEVPTGRHHTDSGGDSDHAFALCSLLSFQFAPRLPDLKHRRLYSFGKPSDHPTLEPMIGGRINPALIRTHWKAILRIVTSIRTASVIMRQLAAYPRQNSVAAALRIGPAGAYPVHARLDQGSRAAPLDRSGAEQGRVSQQPGTGGIHPPTGRDPRSHLREPAAPRFWPQPDRNRHYPVEHPLPGARRRHATPDRGRTGRPSGPPFTAWLGTREPHRRLHLGSQCRIGGRGPIEVATGCA